MTATPLTFRHDTLGQRVLFGANQAAEHVAAEINGRKVMVVASPREMRRARELFADLSIAVWHEDVAMHVPVEVADRARGVAKQHDIDLLMAVGGGSAVGTAKAVALSTGIELIAVPTTYAGSEATDVWGMTEQGRKTTGQDPRVLPTAVIYDSTLTVSLPVDLSVASGLNALAHCVDSLWAPRADPINAALATEGARALTTGLPRVHDNPADLGGRDQLLYGAYLAAVAFASAGAGMHHKICHILGGTFNLPHAPTHAIVLPYVVAFNEPAAAERLGVAFGGLAGLQELRKRIDAPRALRDIGFTAAGIPEVVRQALDAVPASNPRPVTADNLTELLTRALVGADPAG